MFYFFQGQFHSFNNNFTKFQDNSSTNGTIFKFQEFSRTKVNFKDFSMSVRTLVKTDQTDLRLCWVQRPDVGFPTICPKSPSFSVHSFQIKFRLDMASPVDIHLVFVLQEK